LEWWSGKPQELETVKLGNEGNNRVAKGNDC